MIKLRPNQQRSKNAVTALWFALAASVLLAIVEIYTYSTLNGGYMDYDSLMAAAAILGVVGLLSIGAFIASAITFIQWFRRAYFNMHMLVPSSKLKYSEGWAAGAWFIPIFNWFGPYQIAKDMVDNAGRMLSDKGLVSNVQAVSTALGVWWGLWIASSVLGQVDYRMSDQMNQVSSIVSLLSSLASIIAAYLAIQFVKKYSEWEEKLPETVDDASYGTSFSGGQDDLLDSSM